jgi:(p)ppGpp synthase/HD superfamily hydrolase
MARSNFNVLIYKKALDFSYNYYRTRYRKGLKIPYFTYLSSVSNLVIENNGSTEEAIAGLFHDILEDNNSSKRINVIKLKFGNKVLSIVKQCSNLPNLKKENLSWIESKKKFLESMSKKSQSSLLVCICDKFHSLNCLISDYNKIGKKVWKNYDFEPNEAYWYYKSLCQNFKKHLKNHKILKDSFQRRVNELKYFCNAK